VTILSSLKFRHLTQKELGFISNGCGSKGGWIKVPNFIFKASCDHHDINYWIGGTESDRIKADWQFYEAMIEDANSYGWYCRFWYRWWAWVYYQAVRRLGYKYFYYGTPRTREDLVRQVILGDRNG